MKHYLLPEAGNFYKANLHVHTDISDGRVTPLEIKNGYKENGYSIVAYTDHEVFVPHNDLSDDEFIAINAVELAINDNMPGGFKYNKTYHMNLYAKSKDQTECAVSVGKTIWLEQSKKYISDACMNNNYRAYHSVEAMNEFTRRATNDGFLVCYNHPVWSLHDYKDYSGLKGLFGIEVYNTGSARGGYEDTTAPLDLLLNQGERPIPIAADDAHALNGNAYGGWNMIKAKSLTYESVIEAMEKGDTYASTGPEIEELYYEDGVVHIKTSDAIRIFLITDIRYAKVVHGSTDKPVTEAHFDISDYIQAESACEVTRRTAPRFRIEVRDAKGGKAWTRAYFLSELTSPNQSN